MSSAPEAIEAITTITAITAITVPEVPEAPDVSEAPDVPEIRRTLDRRRLLHRVDLAITGLRALLGHDHRDEPWWAARGTSAAEAQYRRSLLRRVADLLHVARATEHGRLHGSRFADLAAQRAWLERMEHHRCSGAAHAAGLPADATLARLRAGELTEVVAAPL